jgi:hypothetical protein
MLNDQIPSNVFTLEAVFGATKRTHDIWEEILFVLQGFHESSRVANFKIIEEVSEDRLRSSNSDL